MGALILGLDLCDDYSQISHYNPELQEPQMVVLESNMDGLIPTALYRSKLDKSWHIGEEACDLAKSENGVIIDQLLKKLGRDGSITLEETAFSAVKLMELFLEQLFIRVKAHTNGVSIDQIVITIQTLELSIMDQLLSCVDQLLVPRQQIHIISHTESFIYYILSQKRDIWNNQVGLFDLTETGFQYYEMMFQRGSRQLLVTGANEQLEDLRIDSLETPAGLKLINETLCIIGERLLHRKVFSSIFLSGMGFENTQWAEDFMRLICYKRKVFVGQNIFAKGAAYLAFDKTRETTSYPYVFLCEGRLNVSVTMKVTHNGKESQLMLASAGDNWYESRVTMEFILDNQNAIDFYISPTDPRKKKVVSIPLEDFPERPNKTTRIEVIVGFKSENCMVVMVRDKGFGELFPAVHKVLKQEVML